MENKPEHVNGDGKECIHHWLINATNLGVCKKCGTSRQFCSSWTAVQKAWYGRPSNVPHVVPDTKG